jgi:hypothetical protein
VIQTKIRKRMVFASTVLSLRAAILTQCRS